MKPRVMFSNGSLRVVRTPLYPRFVLEKRDGYDAMNRGVWFAVKSAENPMEMLRHLVVVFGESMHRREKAMRKARRRRDA